MFGHDFPYLDTRDINLDWLLKNMKTVVQQWTEYQLSMNQQFSNLTNAFNALKDWIEDYFENLDVSAEIEQKLDRMALSGELGYIMRPLVTGEVTEWMSEHITQPTTPVIDTSLLVAGAAADSKAAGDYLRSIRDTIGESHVFNALEDPTIIWHQPTGTYSGITITFKEPGVYTFSGTATGTVVEDYFSNLHELPLGLKAGEKFTFSLRGIYPVTARLFYSTDEQNWTSLQDYTADGDYVVTMPATARGFLVRIYITQNKVLNNTISVQLYGKTKELWESNFEAVAEYAAEYSIYSDGEITPINTISGFYPVNRSTPVSADNYRTKEYAVLPNERIHVITKFSGGSGDGYIQYIKFFNKDKSYWDGLISSAGANTIDTVVTVPFWAATMAICASNPISALDYYVARYRDIAIFIGDSYVQANSLVSAGIDQRLRFSTQLSRRFGWIEKNFAVGGMGYITGATTFPDQIDNAIADVTYDHDKVSKIFIIGGRNDVTSPVDVTALKAGVISAVSKAATAFPNAKIIIVPMLWSDGVIHQHIYRAYVTICDACKGYNVSIIQNAYTWLTGMRDMILSDRVHPNADGHMRICDAITNALMIGIPCLYPDSQKLSKIYAGLGSDDFACTILENSIVSINVRITLSEACSANTLLYSYSVENTQNNQFFISNSNTFIPIYNLATGETGLLRYNTTFENGGYTNSITNITALSTGLWYTAQQMVNFGREIYAGNG